MKRNRITKEDVATVVTIICSPIAVLQQGISMQTALILLLLLLAAYLFCRNGKLKRDLEQQNKMLENTKNLGYPIATLQYFMTQKKRRDFNTYSIDHATVKYNFDTVIKGRYVHQKVEYRFKGNNRGKRAIMSHMMTVSKSVFSDFNMVTMTAYDYIEERSLRVERKEQFGNLQMIEVLFQGEGIGKSKDFDFSIVLEWRDPQRIDAYRYFIIDTKNYSKDVRNLYIELETDEECFEQATKKVLEVNRDTMEYAVIRNLTTALKDGKIYFRNYVEPQKNCIYLLQIRMKPAVDEVKV